MENQVEKIVEMLNEIPEHILQELKFKDNNEQLKKDLEKLGINFDFKN